MTSEPAQMETERLVLRPIRADDGPLLVELYADPQVARFIGGDRLDQAAAQQQAERFSSVWEACGYGQSILRDRATGAVVGRVGLHPWEAWGELELGWVLVRSHQGRGFAHEAASAWMDWAQRTRVSPFLTAVIHPENLPSIRLAERLGFHLGRHDETPWNPVVVYRYDLSCSAPPALPRRSLMPR